MHLNLAMPNTAWLVTKEVFKAEVFLDRPVIEETILENSVTQFNLCRSRPT